MSVLSGVLQSEEWQFGGGRELALLLRLVQKELACLTSHNGPPCEYVLNFNSHPGNHGFQRADLFTGTAAGGEQPDVFWGGGQAHGDGADDQGREGKDQP